MAFKKKEKKKPLKIIPLPDEYKDGTIGVGAVFSKYALMLFNKYLPETLRGHIVERETYRLFWLEGERNNTELLLQIAKTEVVRYLGTDTGRNGEKIARLEFLNQWTGEEQRIYEQVKLPLEDYGYTWFLLSKSKEVSTF